jgi:hypothetical protein
MEQSGIESVRGGKVDEREVGVEAGGKLTFAREPETAGRCGAERTGEDLKGEVALMSAGGEERGQE